MPIDPSTRWRGVDKPAGAHFHVEKPVSQEIACLREKLGCYGVLQLSRRLVKGKRLAVCVECRMAWDEAALRAVGIDIRNVSEF